MSEESSPKFSRLKIPGRGTNAEEKKYQKVLEGDVFITNEQNLCNLFLGCEVQMETNGPQQFRPILSYP